MKTKITLIILLATIATSGAWAQRGIVKQDRKVTSFSAINASGGWNVIIRQGDRQSVTIEVSEEELERAIIEVKNGTLHISSKNRNRLFSIFNPDDITRRAYVTVTDLKKVTASGGVDIRFSTPLKTNDFEVVLSGGTDLEDLTLHCTDFNGQFSGGCDAEIRFASVETVKVNASGGCDVELEGISARSCRVEASGGCDVELKGKTDELNLTASGGCDVSASELTARNGKVNFSGAADGSIRVTGRLDVIVSGAADVTCYGNPTDITDRVDRSSSFKLR